MTKYLQSRVLLSKVEAKIAKPIVMFNFSSPPSDLMIPTTPTTATPTAVDEVRIKFDIRFV